MLGTAEAAEVAMQALDQPVDRFLDHGLWLTARDLQTAWLPALSAGQIDFDGNVRHLTFVLQAAGSPGVVGPLMDLWAQGKLPADRHESVLLLVAAMGGPKELGVVFRLALDDQTDPALRTELLAALFKAAQMRKVQPEGDLTAIGAIIDLSDEPLRLEAIRAAGAWHVEAMRERFNQLATAADTSDAIRAAALDALASLGPASQPTLLSLSAATQPAQRPRAGHRRLGGARPGQRGSASNRVDCRRRDRRRFGRRDRGAYWTARGPPRRSPKRSMAGSCPSTPPNLRSAPCEVRLAKSPLSWRL